MYSLIHTWQIIFIISNKKHSLVSAQLPFHVIIKEQSRWLKNSKYFQAIWTVLWSWRTKQWKIKIYKDTQPLLNFCVNFSWLDSISEIV